MGGSSLIEVFSTDTKVIHLPIPQSDRYRISLGDSVVFVSQMAGSPPYEGTLIDIADQPVFIGTEYVFWAVAELPESVELQIGMTGSAQLKVVGERTGLLSDLRRQLLGP